MIKQALFTPKGFHNTAQGRRFGAPWVSEPIESVLVQFETRSARFSAAQRRRTLRSVSRIVSKNIGKPVYPGCAEAATLGCVMKPLRGKEGL